MTGPTSLALRDLQEWMSILIRHPRDAATAARTTTARRYAPVARVNEGAIVAPTDRLSAYDRLDIYNNGYLARLVEVLESDFAGLMHALGEDAWLGIARAYVTRHPSTHPNLNELNRKMPAFLSRRNIQNRVFLRDLARLEVLVTEAFDAPRGPKLELAELQDLTDEQWEHVVFEPDPSLRLLASSFPVNHYLQTVYDGGDARPLHEVPPVRTKNQVAVYRKDYRVWRMTLPRSMFLVLEALVAGKPLGVALAAAGRHDEDFQRWFGEWTGDGLFAAIRTVPGSG